MPGPTLDLRRPGPRSATHPAVRPLLRVGVIGAVLVLPGALAMIRLQPFGDDSPCARYSDGSVICLGVDTWAMQLAHDLLGLLIVVTAVLVAAIGWALWRHRDEGLRPILVASAVMAGTVAVALATPVAWSSLPGLGYSGNELWGALWLAAPPIVLGHRLLGGRALPALLALLLTAWLSTSEDFQVIAFFPAVMWLVSAVLALWLWRRRQSTGSSLFSSKGVT